MNQDEIPQDFGSAFQAMLSALKNMQSLDSLTRAEVTDVLLPLPVREHVTLTDGELVALAQMLKLTRDHPVGSVVMAFMMGKHSERQAAL